MQGFFNDRRIAQFLCPLAIVQKFQTEIFLSQLNIDNEAVAGQLYTYEYSVP